MGRQRSSYRASNVKKEALQEPPVLFKKLPIDKVTTTSIMIFFQQEGKRSKCINKLACNDIR